MASVTGITADRALEIEGESVVSGAIVGSHLILTTKDGTQIDAGVVVPSPTTGIIATPEEPFIPFQGIGAAAAGLSEAIRYPYPINLIGVRMAARVAPAGTGVAGDHIGDLVTDGASVYAAHATQRPTIANGRLSGGARVPDSTKFVPALASIQVQANQLGTTPPQDVAYQIAFQPAVTDTMEKLQTLDLPLANGTALTTLNTAATGIDAFTDAQGGTNFAFTSAPTAPAVAPVQGTGCVKVVCPGSGSQYGRLSFPGASKEMFVSFHVQVSAYPSGFLGILSFYAPDGTTHCWRLVLTQTGRFVLQDNALASYPNSTGIPAAAGISLNTWYRVEVRTVMGSGAANGYREVKVFLAGSDTLIDFFRDATTDPTTGATAVALGGPGTVQHADFGRHGPSQTTTGTYYLDCLRIGTHGWFGIYGG